MLFDGIWRLINKMRKGGGDKAGKCRHAADDDAERIGGPRFAGCAAWRHRILTAPPPTIGDVQNLISRKSARISRMP